MDLRMLPWAAVCAAALLACSPAAPEGGTPATPDSAAPRDLCYLKVTTRPTTVTGTDTLPGTSDSLAVHLHIAGDQVTGHLSWLPGEKDRMTGSLLGTIHGSRIVAVYSYSAEGTTAKEEKIMRIDDQGLHLKSGELAEKDGIWMLADTATAYTETIPPAPCP
jgi:hypothetical protein